SRASVLKRTRPWRKTSPRSLRSSSARLPMRTSRRRAPPTSIAQPTRPFVTSFPRWTKNMQPRLARAPYKVSRFLWIMPLALLAGAALSATTPATQKAEPAHPVAARYHPDRFAGRAGTYYRTVWGVDSLGVKWVESGEVIRFTYRVLDPSKAVTLNDKQA